MRVKNNKSFKQLCRNLSAKTGIPVDIVRQNYMIERVLHRLSVSKYRDLFIIKGGFLLSSMIGLGRRATQDLDSIIISPKMDKDQVLKMFEEILAIDVGDLVSFEITKSYTIGKDTEFEGINLNIDGYIDDTRVSFSIDITCGEKESLRDIEYGFPMLFDEGTINVLCYTIESMMADKILAILSRNTETTRMRDFYDINIIYKSYKDEIDFKILRELLVGNSKRKKCENELGDYKRIIEEIRNSDQIKSRWSRYQNEKSNLFALDIDINESLDIVLEILKTCKL